jgi:hypothetical protein
MDVARQVGVPLEYALTLLDLESSGGLNVWGHDAVKCGPVGGDVTEANYKAYLANRDTCGSQGCGPMQLTFRGFQDEADRRGGCWVPRINIEVGLEAFARNYVLAGDRAAFKAYNGKDTYATEAVVRLEMWRRVIQGETII